MEKAVLRVDKYLQSMAQDLHNIGAAMRYFPAVGSFMQVVSVRPIAECQEQSHSV